MPATPNLKREARREDNRDGLDFVRTTTRLTPGKDNRNEYVHPTAAHFKSH